MLIRPITVQNTQNRYSTQQNKNNIAFGDWKSTITEEGIRKLSSNEANIKSFWGILEDLRINLLNHPKIDYRLEITPSSKILAMITSKETEGIGATSYPKFIRVAFENVTSNGENFKASLLKGTKDIESNY